MDFAVLDTYFQSIVYPFTQHHIDSFHNMFKTHIPNTIRSYNPIVMLKEDTATKKEIIRVEVHIGNSDLGDGLYVDRPTYLDQDGKTILMLPQEARLRNLTYATKLYADITVNYFTDISNLSDDVAEKVEPGKPFAVKKFPNTIIGRIPIMLHSDQCVLHKQGSKVLQAFGECPMDPGGYFIVDGKEKVIVSQERIVTNRLFVSQLANDDNLSYRGYVHCTAASGETALSPRSVEFVLVKKIEPALVAEDDPPPKPRKGGFPSKDGTDANDPVKNQNKMYKFIQGAILVSLPSIKGRLPLTTVFRAFGILTDKEIVEAICGPVEDTSTYHAYLNFLRPSIAHTGPIIDVSKGTILPVWSMEEALEVLKDRVYFRSTEHLKTIMATDIFPNIEGGLANKAKYLGYLVGTFMRVSLGLLPESDRDSFIYKRIDVSGMLLSQLFQETYVRFRNGIRDRMDQRYYWHFRQKDVVTMRDIVETNSLSQILHGNPSDPDFDVITTTMQKSLKGMWGPPVSDPELGKVQDLSRISYIGTLSHLRRVNNDLDRSIKITSPHRLHSQQWGIMCPFESPDGASIGYLKNFALLAQVTFGTSPDSVIEAIRTIDVGAQGGGRQIVKEISELSALFLARRDAVKIFINGNLYGVTIDPVRLVYAIRVFRRNGILDPFLSIAWNIKENEIRVNTDAGRPCRPLFIVTDQEVIAEKHKSIKDLSWEDLLLGKGRHFGTYDEFVSPYAHDKFQGRDLDSVLKELEKTQGCIEYLDIEEENTMLIAMKREDLQRSGFYTHLEIHPSTALSVVTNIVPFANHNQAPRIYFHGAQSKQAVGIYATNWHKRFDTAGYIQHYPQRRIVSTRGSHYNGNNMMPNGCNVIVAIMTHTGFNQEDSIMINRRAIDRGLFQMTAYKTVTASEKVLSATERVFFANPKKMQAEGKQIMGLKKADYTLIGGTPPPPMESDTKVEPPSGGGGEGGGEGADGIISEEAYIPRDQKAVVIGMVHMTQAEKQVRNGVFTDKVLQPVYKDVSVTTDVNHYGKVDRVFVGTTVPTNPEKICKVRFRKIRRPEPGNKFCSAHGQKGVVGMILEQENMPFTKDGVVPDIIINPHALPSRMTMGHLIETVFAKLCCMEGCYGDGTVFIPFEREQVFDRLSKFDYERYGNEILYDGRTGMQVETSIFIGPIYYYQLKHMVVDKVQSRGVGEVKRVQLTHQPTSGRSAGGGLRIGEMERDVLIGHGVSAFIRECMMEKADKYTWAICRHCGTLADYNPDAIAWCRGCNHDDIAVIDTPWAFKLLIQELEGMGIQPRLSTDPVNDSEDTAHVSQEGGIASLEAEVGGPEQLNGEKEEDAEEDDEDAEEDDEDAEEDDEDAEEDDDDAEEDDDDAEEEKDTILQQGGDDAYDPAPSAQVAQDLSAAAPDPSTAAPSAQVAPDPSAAAPSAQVAPDLSAAAPSAQVAPAAVQVASDQSIAVPAAQYSSIVAPSILEEQAVQVVPDANMAVPVTQPAGLFFPPTAVGGIGPYQGGSRGNGGNDVKTIEINMSGNGKHEPPRSMDDYNFDDDEDNEFLSI